MSVKVKNKQWGKSSNKLSDFSKIIEEEKEHSVRTEDLDGSLEDLEQIDSFAPNKGFNLELESRQRKI
jgi:hypothetical protein